MASRAAGAIGKPNCINALTIVDRGWAKPADMIGSWAGAMGHTQWMPEVWLHMGVDYDRDGRANPFGNPADALAGTARYLVERGHYRRGEAWGCEVNAGGATRRATGTVTSNGTRSACGAPTASRSRARTTARAYGSPERGGPAFLIGRNFYAVQSYNPSRAYTLATCHARRR